MPGMYSVTCPNCGEKVDVPSGHHVVVATQASRFTHAGITVDGRDVHACGRPAPKVFPRQTV